MSITLLNVSQHGPPSDLTTISDHAEKCLAGVPTAIKRGEGTVAKSLTDPRYKAMITALVALRHAAGLTQRQVAERIGEAQNSVWKIEHCQQRLDPLQLVEWLRAIEADEKKFLVETVAAIPSGKKKRR